MHSSCKAFKLLCLQTFLPVTLEKPKMLLPLVNIPMMEYTLEWLAASEVEEVCTNQPLVELGMH